jgi:cytochrome c oxidase cbb3-type subunit 3
MPFNIQNSAISIFSNSLYTHQLPMAFSPTAIRLAARTAAALLLTCLIAVIVRAQAPQPAAPPGGRGGQGGGRASQQSPASQKPPQTVTAQAYAPELVQRGQAVFASTCGFCHGRDAMGGETGPDLTRSPLVAEDVRGDKIIPLVHTGRIDKGMPPQNLPDADLEAIVAFIHDAKTKADSLEGNRRTVDVADLQTGNAQLGQQYFNGAGGCSKCHSPTGDFAGLAGRVQGLQLFQRMLYPGGRGRGGAAPPTPTATIKLASGESITGKVAYRDEFNIAITDSAGDYRSWPTSKVKVTIDNPLDAHIAQLAKYTNDDLHNVLAYLQTLK